LPDALALLLETREEIEALVGALDGVASIADIGDRPPAPRARTT
jgi:hypothetical protein